MRLRDVRIESHRRDQSSIGLTALIEVGEHTLIQYAVRRWPDDGSAHELAWTAVDQHSGLQLAQRGGGLGGSVHPDGGVVALDGGIWLERPARGPLRVQCRRRDELLIDADMGSGHLSPVPSPVEHLDVLEPDRPRWLRVMEDLEAAGWRGGRATADEIIAVDARRSMSGPLGIEPFAIERWGRLLRVAVSIAESDEVDYPPPWWRVEIGGRSVDALGEHFQSGRTANLIGHLVMVDPAPERQLRQL